MMMLRQIFAGRSHPTWHRRNRGGRRVFSPRLWLLGAMPSNQRTQAMLAEMLAQALSSEMGLVAALETATEVVRRGRLGQVLGRVTGMVATGEEVVDSFRWAGVPLHADVQAAIEVAESRGDLGGELAAAARRLDARVADHIAAAIGRRRSARRFAASLARLLSQEPLTFQLVHDAARLVGPRDRHFCHVIRWLALDIEGGSPFADALSCYPRVFDGLFVRCVENAHSRESMRRVLLRIGSEE